MAEGDGRPPRRRPYDYGVPSDYDDYDDYDDEPGAHGRWSGGHRPEPYGQQQAPYGQQPVPQDQFGQPGRPGPYVQQDPYGGQQPYGGEYAQSGQESGGGGYAPADPYAGPGGQHGGGTAQFGGGYGQQGGGAAPYGRQRPGGSHPNGRAGAGYSPGGAQQQPNGTSGYYGSYDGAEPYQYQYTEPYDYTGQSAGGGLTDGGAAPPQGATRQLRQVQQPGRPGQFAQQPQSQPEPVEVWGPPSGAETLQLRVPYSVPGPYDEDTGESSATTDSGRTVRPTGGRAERRRAAKRLKRRRRLSATREIPILIGVALLIAVVLKTFLVQAFVIPSGSMEETIRIGDRVLVDKLTPWFGSKPARGDVVVFQDPGGWLSPHETHKKDPPFGVKQGKELLTAVGLLPSDDEQDLIKRVVGVGGDHVRCCDAQGRVTVNGTPLKEPYLHPGNSPSDLKFDVHVPAGRVFVMGDHRANSADSRYHLRDSGHGTVSENLVVGRAVVIAWPFGHWRRLEEPKTYASVPNAGSASTAAPGDGDNPLLPLPSPAELPLVIGVVGLSRLRGRRQWTVRSDGAGLGGRRSARFWRRRWRRRAERAPGAREP